MLRYYHPEVEWTSTEDYIERATYRGHEGLRRYFGTMEEQFNDLRIDPVELIDAGEQVVGSVRFTGRGKASGAPVELTLISVGSLRDGLIFRIRNYPDMASALEAAGLSEQLETAALGEKRLFCVPSGGFAFLSPCRLAPPRGGVLPRWATAPAMHRRARGRPAPA